MLAGEGDREAVEGFVSSSSPFPNQSTPNESSS